ncbi:MAG: ParB N-terminal domain-containing protein [Syntrophorhabdales bacterium]|jgi:ParB/RepB/Spo0J family partition protein
MGERYAAFRIVSPKADEAMAKSMKKYGQLSPVVCAKIGDGCELVDGFKRLRACRSLGKETLKARVLNGTERVLKAAIIQLNRGRSISGLEEAMVLSSLYRDDGLSQTETAVLLGRHKSWVSRRISLIERLSDEVRQDVRLGLLSQSMGRELAMLPRGNQKEAAHAIIKHRLSTREAAKLIAYLLSRPKWDYHCILASPWKAVGPREPRPKGFAIRLASFARVCTAVAEGMKTIAPEEAQRLSGLIGSAVGVAEAAIAALKEAL